MIIQCRESLFNFICDFLNDYEPQIIVEDGGYIHCFDKDWILMQLPDNLTVTARQTLIDKISLYQLDEQFVIGIPDTMTLIQRNVSESEKYIFLRKHEDKYEIRWGASSYVRFNKIRRTNKNE
jgi:hypothetical protein